MKQSRGVYFLANDRVINLVIAFLNSFRLANPTLPLCLIPYDSDYSRLEELQNIYLFSIFDNPEVLQWCDRINSKFIDKYRGHFRKLAAWQGEFDEFIYIDIDTVVLSNLNFVFDFLENWNFVTSHSNYPSLKQWVWQAGIETTGYLTSEQIDYSANTGFVASKRDLLDREHVDSQLAKALELKPYMQLFCQEQPLLNYLIVTSGDRYTSITSIMAETDNYQIPREIWAGEDGGITWAGKILFPFDKSIHNVLLIHWAGEWQPRKKDYRLHKRLKHLKLVKSPAPKRRYFMKYERLWRYYRHFNSRPWLTQ